MSRFHIMQLPLPGLMRITRQRLGDQRGFLSRLFCAQELAVAGWTVPIAQINLTRTERCGTVRGMHFQHPPHAEMKLVSCLRGEVWDVVVDLRADSATFLQWHGEHLTADNGQALLIPAGFAHGFQTLSDDVEMLYCHSANHVPASEGALNALDAKLAIDWPLLPSNRSERDLQHPFLAEDYRGITL